MVIRASFVSAGTGKGEGTGAAQIPLRGISSYSAIITTVDSSWRIRSARAHASGSGAIITVLHPLLGLSYEWSTSLAA